MVLQKIEEYPGSWGLDMGERLLRRAACDSDIFVTGGCHFISSCCGANKLPGRGIITVYECRAIWIGPCAIGVPSRLGSSESDSSGSSWVCTLGGCVWER